MYKRLEMALNDCDRFYKSESLQFVIARYEHGTCYKIKCYGLDCLCQETESCRLENGESIKIDYPDAVEITRDEFIQYWTTCVIPDKSLD